jgi:hypothetical protein
MNVKQPFWNSAVSNASGQKLLQLFDVNNFEISPSQCPTHYSAVGNGDVLDIVVHKNIRLSNVIVSDILDSYHLPIIFYILEPLKRCTEWNRVQSLPAHLKSPRTEINLGIEADKAVRNFAASIASAYQLFTTKPTLSELNNDVPGLDHLLKYKKRLRKCGKNPGIQHVNRHIIGSRKQSGVRPAKGHCNNVKQK